jgi:hypothetical protein
MPLIKLVPLTVKVKPLPPAVAEDGEMDVVVGVGGVPDKVISSILNCVVEEVCLHLSLKLDVEAPAGRLEDIVTNLQTAVPVPVACAGNDIELYVVPSELHSKANSDILDAVVLLKAPKEIDKLVQPEVFIPEIIKSVPEVLVKRIFPPPEAPVYPEETLVFLTSPEPENVKALF